MGRYKERTDCRGVRDIGALGAMDVCTDDLDRISCLVEDGQCTTLFMVYL